MIRPLLKGKSMKIKHEYLIAIALVFLAGFIFSSYKACSLYDYASVLKGRGDALAEQLKAQEKDAAQAVKIYETIIAARDKTINSLTVAVLEKESAVTGLNARLDELEGIEATLTDKDEIILNLRGQIKVWSDKFSLAEGIIKDKDGIIFSLTEKYDAQVKVSLEYKGLWEKGKELQRVSDVRIKVLEKEVKSARLSRTVRVAAVIVGAAFIVNEVRK